MSNTTPVFHVGFPKAGSTTLQIQVFPNLPNVEYLGLPPSPDNADEDLYKTLHSFYENTFKIDGIRFALERRQEDLAKILSNVPAGKIPLFSYEPCIGNVMAYPEAIAKAERLKEIFKGELKIIIIIREQTAILTSQYRDHPFDPQNVSTGKPVSFENWYKMTQNLRYFRFTDLIFYDRMINFYDDLFGAKNVLVLPLELMSQNPELYAQKMAAFIGIKAQDILTQLGKEPENTGYSAGINQNRRLGRYFPYLEPLVEKLPSGWRETFRRFNQKQTQEQVTLSDALQKDIHTTYAASNTRTSKRLQIDLKKPRICM